MLFNSLEFLAFFPLVTLVYFCLPHKHRWFWLLAASIFFYMTFIPVYVLVLFALIIIDYYAGLFIEASKSMSRKKAFLLASIISMCAVLFVFKYFNFFNANVALLAELLGWNYSMESLRLLLPIGLSFHTFQSLSYVIEVYKGRQKAERNFGIYALYVMFYPQLVAGPIERPQNLLHQFYEKHKFSYEDAIEGLKLMLWGFFKKIAIADRLAVLVNAVYGNVHDYSGMMLTLATVFFAFQVYFDFSGYSDIARGAARFMGFRLMVNFNKPYFSKSISEFWTRWHISLSTWFKDYIYNPMMEGKLSMRRLYLAVLVVFAVSGLWHGAAWTFVIWGLLHGFYIIFSILTEQYRARLANVVGLTRFPWLHNLTKITITFSLVCFTYIFFRAQSIQDAWYIITHIFANWDLSLSGIAAGLPDKVTNLKSIIITCALVVFMECIEASENGAKLSWISKAPRWTKLALYYLIIMLTLLFGVFKQLDFIYFQF